MNLQNTRQQGSNPLFPVFLQLEKLNVLLVGAGKVGAEKLGALLRNAPSASIEIVAVRIDEEIKTMAAAYPAVHLRQKFFDVADLEGKDIVLVAINNKEDSAAIREACRDRRLLVNVADTPGLCDFYLGSVVQKGALKIAISTNGKSPTMAKRIRELLEDALPEEVDELIHHLHDIRNRLQGNFTEKVQRLNEITQALAGK